MVPEPDPKAIPEHEIDAKLLAEFPGLQWAAARCIKLHKAILSIIDEKRDLNEKQWHAMMFLHKNLLQEYYCFFFACKDASANPGLQEWASKALMPARLWQQSIHPFLEVLRQWLPSSQEYMLDFLKFAYDMMILIFKNVPAFANTWIECLGDLGRYRMAIEDEDTKARKDWADVSRHWYSKVSDRNPATGRLYFHLAMLASPYSLEKLHYVTKSLCAPIPHTQARKVIKTVFQPVLGNSPVTFASSEVAFIRAHVILISEESMDQLEASMSAFNDRLNDDIAESASEWLKSGYNIANSLSCSLLGYGCHTNILMQAISGNVGTTGNSTIPQASLDERFKLVLTFSMTTIRIVFSRVEDPNILPFTHVILVFVDYMTQNPEAMAFIEEEFPWGPTCTLLNALSASKKHSCAVATESSLPSQVVPRDPLPEEFAMRGLLYAESYLPDGRFRKHGKNTDERFFELSHMRNRRVERILSLAHKIAHSGHWLTCDALDCKFSAGTKNNIRKA